MIFQILFTFAVEFTALVLSTTLYALRSHERVRHQRLVAGIGLFTLIGSLVLIAFTTLHLILFLAKPAPAKIGVQPPWSQPQQVQTPKLQMQVLPSGPVKGGIISPDQQRQKSGE